MKLFLITLLAVSNLTCNAEEPNHKKTNHDELAKKTVIVIGVVGSCLLVRRHWSSVAWVSKKHFTKEIG